MSNNIAQLMIYFKSRIWRPNTLSQDMFLLRGYLITGISFFFSLFFPFYKLTENVGGKDRERALDVGFGVS